jgi:hypothetical protein
MKNFSFQRHSFSLKYSDYKFYQLFDTRITSELLSKSPFINLAFVKGKHIFPIRNNRTTSSSHVNKVYLVCKCMLITTNVL